MKKYVLLLLCMALILSVTGCGRSAEPEKIVIGAALPLTGGLSTEGVKHRDGYDLWAKKVNDAGGIEVNGKKLPVEIKYYDYQSDTNTAVKLVEKLITEDKVSMILGPFGSGAAKAVSAVTEKYRVPMIAPSASSEEVFDNGYKYLFGTFTPNNTLTEPLSDIAVSVADAPKTIAVIARNDLFPLSIGQEAVTSAEKRNIEVVVNEQYAIGTTDFSPMLIQVADKAPDWIFATGYATDLILLRKQMEELNIHPKMLTMIAGAVYQEFIDGTEELSENVTTACWWSNSVKYVGDDVFVTSEAFTKEFEDVYGYTPDYESATAAACGIIFQKAIEKAGSLDPVAIRDAIATLDFTSFYGPIKFDDRGMASALTPPIIQIINGKHVPIFPDDIKEHELIYPMK